MILAKSSLVSLFCFCCSLLLVVGLSLPVSAEKLWPNSPDQANLAGSWPELDQISAKAWLVVDLEDGTEIISSNPDLKLYPASTTKIMTALLALSDPFFNPDQVLTASETAVDLGWDSSKIYLQKDETIRMQDALAGLMLASGNDAANVIAESLTGSIEAFARMMNDKASELGANNTNFVNPHGLHDENHYTTAADLAVIASTAMELPEFRTLVKTASYSLPASNKHLYNGWNTILNTNRLLHFDQSYLQSDYIDEIIGIKTGTTNAAGFCLISAATTHDDRQLLSVLLGVPRDEIQGNTWIYSRTLLEEAAITIGSPSINDLQAPENTSSIEQTTTGSQTSSETLPSDSVDGTTGVTQVQSNDQDSGWKDHNPWLLVSILLIVIIIALILMLLVQHNQLIRIKRRKTAKTRRIIK